jgi:hypothetical protein
MSVAGADDAIHRHGAVARFVFGCAAENFDPNVRGRQGMQGELDALEFVGGIAFAHCVPVGGEFVTQLESAAVVQWIREPVIRGAVP